MSTETNNPNPKGTQWYNHHFYAESQETPVSVEEDYQVEALPTKLLHRILAVRLGILYAHEATWRGKFVNTSAISDTQLLHHISLRLEGKR